MNAKKHICPETIKISYNLKGLWNETSFSFAQHLSTPAGSLTLLEKPKLGKCQVNWHWLLLRAPKSAGLPQLTCSTPRQSLQRLQGWAQSKAGCAARRRHRSARRGSRWRTSRHIQLGWNPQGPINTTSAEIQSALQPPAGSPALPYPFLILSPTLGIQTCGIRLTTGYKEAKKNCEHLFSWTVAQEPHTRWGSFGES